MKNKVVAPSNSANSFSKIYGLSMYIISQLAILFWALFLCNAGPFRVDGAGYVELDHPLVVDVALVLVFALQHLIMARKSFKKRLARIIPAHLVRSTFVGAAGLSLFLMVFFWQPLPETVYRVEGLARILIWIAYGAGWLLVIFSTQLINNRELHGLTQSFRGKDLEESGSMVTPSLYRFVRHPMMLGFLIVLWATPDMSLGRLLIAGSMTAYILIGIRFEERALRHRFGNEYRLYQKNVPALIPFFRYGMKKKIIH